MLEKSVKAQLILETGEKFHGFAFGHISETVGEVTFTTDMAGYQELLTDPAFAGKIICFSYPMIGNYGINLEDMEGEGIKPTAIIVRQYCNNPNNWRCEMELSAFLKLNRLTGIEGIDTRALTKIICEKGEVKALITTDDEITEKEIRSKFESFQKIEGVKAYSTKEKYVIEGNNGHIAVLDLGVKRSVLEVFKRRDIKVTVYPYNSRAEVLLEDDPDAVFISNGSGSPEEISESVDEIKKIILEKPALAVGLGHLAVCASLGGSVKKMTYCQNGANYPVKNKETGRVFTVPHNKKYRVLNAPRGAVVTYTGVNDGKIEGLYYNKLKVSTYQFEPDTVPLKTNCGYIYQDFLDKVIPSGNNKEAADSTLSKPKATDN